MHYIESGMYSDSETGPTKIDKSDQRNESRDFSDEVVPLDSRFLRGTLIACGCICVALAVLGVFLPILPTTPFLLLAAALFARSSVRFYNWLLNNKLLGPYIHQWRSHRTVPLHAKVVGIILVILTIGTSVYFVIPQLSLKILVGAIGVALVIFLSRLPVGNRVS